MTFLAAFLDLLPMAIGIGRGSEANVPLARAVVGGLLTSTALTRFVVPIMYTLLLKESSGDEIDIEAELADVPEPPRSGGTGAYADRRAEASLAAFGFGVERKNDTGQNDTWGGFPNPPAQRWTGGLGNPPTMANHRFEYWMLSVHGKMMEDSAG